MKKLYKDQTISLYKVQRDLKLNHGTLYKYARGEINIKNMPMKTLLKLARYFNIDAEKLFNEMVDWQNK